MELIAAFSLGVMAGVGFSAAVAYYKVKKYVDPRSIVGMFKKCTPKVFRLSSVDLVEYNHCGATHHMMVPYSLDNIFNYGTQHYKIEFDNGAKVKTDLMPGQWIAGKFKDYSIKRMVVKFINLEGDESSPMEVFDSSIDDPEQEIWPTVIKFFDEAKSNPDGELSCSSTDTSCSSTCESSCSSTCESSCSSTCESSCSSTCEPSNRVDVLETLLGEVQQIAMTELGRIIQKSEKLKGE